MDAGTADTYTGHAAVQFKQMKSGPIASPVIFAVMEWRIQMNPEELVTRACVSCAPAIFGYSLFEYMEIGEKVSQIFLKVAQMIPAI